MVGRGYPRRHLQPLIEGSKRWRRKFHARRRAIDLMRRVTAADLSVRVTALLLALVLPSCGGGHRPPVVQPPPFNEAAARVTCEGIWRAELQRGIDPSGLAGCLADLRRGASVAQITANVRASEEYKQLHAPPPPGRLGQVRAVNAALADDSGGLLGYGTSLFWALWGIEHDADRLDRNLADARAAGFEYVRVLATVGPGGWTDRAVDWKSPGWAVRVAALTDRVRDKYGMRVEWSLLGGSATTKSAGDREAMVRAFIAAIVPRQSKVWAIELSNEANDLTYPEAKRLAGILRAAGFSGLLAITSPTTDACDDQAAWYAGTPATFATIHFSRATDGEGGAWRPARQPWRESRFTCPSVPHAYSNDEPRGPRSSVTMEARPELLGADAVTTWIAGVSSYTFHTGAGVRGGGFEDLHGTKPYIPRPANLRDVENWTATTNTIRALRALLPADVPNWAKGSSRPAMFDVEFANVERVYCAAQDAGMKPGSRFACSAVHVHGVAKLTAKRAMRVEVYSTRDAAKVQSVDLPSGGALRLDPSAPGALLLGSFQ
jgi:hypothetical protein